MVSLTTVYLLSVILTSIAGIGSAFAGNKVSGGSNPQPTFEPPELELEAPDTSIEQTEPEVPLESS